MNSLTAYMVAKHDREIRDLQYRMSRVEMELSHQQARLSIILCTLTARIMLR